MSFVFTVCFLKRIFSVIILFSPVIIYFFTGIVISLLLIPFSDPLWCKDSARREKSQRKSIAFSFGASEPPSALCKDSCFAETARFGKPVCGQRRQCVP